MKQALKQALTTTAPFMPSHLRLLVLHQKLKVLVPAGVSCRSIHARVFIPLALDDLQENAHTIASPPRQQQPGAGKTDLWGGVPARRTNMQ